MSNCLFFILPCVLVYTLVLRIWISVRICMLRAHMNSACKHFIHIHAHMKLETERQREKKPVLHVCVCVCFHLNHERETIMLINYAILVHVSEISQFFLRTLVCSVWIELSLDAVGQGNKYS